MMFWEYMERGLAAGAWVIGLVLSLGLFLGAASLLFHAAMLALGKSDEKEDL